VRIGCLPSLGLVVSRLLAEFSDTVPEARWSLVTSLRGVMIDSLRSGSLDLAICEAKTDENITNMPLARESLHLVLRSDHPLAGSAVVTPDDLDGIPYIGFARGMGATIEAQRFFAAGNAYPPSYAEVTDAKIVLDLVGRVNGFGIVPHSALGNDPTLAVVRTDPAIVRQVSLSHLTDRVLPATAYAFARYVTENWPRSSDVG
jgi:DNA-binding transcriptional LysR family regulator